MTSLTKTCKNCAKPFAIAPEDTEFYKKIDVATPTLCPTCRSQRRQAFRNEFFLYTRKCDFSGKEIISMYSQEKPYKIYDQEIWWSDKWDPTTYGRDFDFNRPFFEQFIELQKVVPRISLNCINNQNSYFTNYAFNNKNCYLIFTTDYCEDSYYGRLNYRNFKCVDADYTSDSIHSYQISDADRANNCLFCQKITGSSNLTFCYDMKNCHDCIGCSNLRSARRYIFNKQVSQEEFEEFKAKMDLGSYNNLEKITKQFADMVESKCPKKYLENVNCDECVGNHLKSSKNAKMCFDSEKLHDIKFGTQLTDAKDCYDWDFVAAGGELCYEMVSCAYRMVSCKFCVNSWDGNSNITYCDLCLGNKDLFGCIGMRKKQYCILNKQYEKEEYDKLLAKIIEHMKKTGEWGEFFPITSSPFAYNESVANEFFTLTEEQIKEKGWSFKEPDKKEFKKQTYLIPDHIKDVPNTITQEILACEKCGKNYKIIEQELAFYKESNLPIPHKCHLCRHRGRTAKRSPRMIWKRTCSKCKIEIQTTYSPNNPSPILCEKCYLEHVG